MVSSKDRQLIDLPKHTNENLQHNWSQQIDQAEATNQVNEDTKCFS